MSAAVVSLSHREHIVVDLDGTLVMTDTFVASLLEAIRKRPTCLPRLVAALFRGRASCKLLAASLGRLNAASLPYNEPLLVYLREQRAAGRRLILATGADLSIAEDVAAHLGIFHEVIGSDGHRNVTGGEKVKAIKARLGELPFAYAGNSRADMRVWHESKSAILVGAPRSCERELRAAGIPVQRDFEATGEKWRPVLRCLRPHQWSKNILVLVPILLSHRIADVSALNHAFLALLALSCCASALYVVNDLLDLQADRLHPTKRLRPLAAGKISVGAGLAVTMVLLLAAGGMAAMLPLSAGALLAAYACTSFVYSLKLKRMLFVDIVCLATLYTVRVLYGGAAAGITISMWTLAFSLFLFASLATLKRLNELRKVDSTSGVQEYRAYKEIDVTQLSSLASAGSYVAVLVLALYINSPEVVPLYRHPQQLWLLCPILIYWTGRISLIANRGHLDADPVAFALKDRATWVVGLMALIVLALSTR